MKRLFTFIMAIGMVSTAWTADRIVVEAKFIEYPATATFTLQDWAAKDYRKKKGFDVLAAPRVETANGQSASLTVGEQRKVPDAEHGGQRTIIAGIDLKVLPTLDSAKIKFNAALTTKRFADAQKLKDATATELAVRECYLEGAVNSGESIMFNTRAAQDGKKLAVILTFSRQP
jgi:hypothetical protein